MLRRSAARIGAALTNTGLLAGCVSGAAAPDEGDHEAAPWGAARLPVTVPGVKPCDTIDQAAAPARGEALRLPDLTLPCLTRGSAVNPSRLSGRPTVINLWATWCQPCRQEMPMLQAASQRYGRRVQFLGVNTKDNPDWAAEFLPQVGVTYPEMVDADGQLLASLRSPGLPVTVVVDAQGRISGRQIGRITEQRLDALLDGGGR